MSVTRKTLAVGGTLAAIAGSTVVMGAAALAGLTPIPQVGQACSWSRFAMSSRPRAVPANYRAIYAGAALDSGLDCAVLAGIGEVETDHGRSPAPGVRSGVNFAGCCAGPMQFNVKDGTWAAYGKGGDVYNPADAIPAAARKLKADGAPDYHRALLAYNNSESYVRTVLMWADRYRGRQVIDGRGDYLNPFPVGQWIRGRTDQGVDMCPLGGRPVRMIGRGTIGLSQQIARGWLDGGELTYTLVDGDHAGVSIYFAEDFVPSKRASRRVWPAGTVIGHAFDGHHCIEQGFAAGPTTDAPASPYKRQGLSDGGNTTGGLEMTRWMRELGAQTLEDPGPGPDHP